MIFVNLFKYLHVASKKKKKNRTFLFIFFLSLVLGDLTREEYITKLVSKPFSACFGSLEQDVFLFPSSPLPLVSWFLLPSPSSSPLKFIYYFQDEEQAVPTNLDWRSTGNVAPVENEGQVHLYIHFLIFLKKISIISYLFIFLQ